MYKVFIENRPIIFIEKNKKKAKWVSIQAKEIKSLQKDLLPKIEALEENSPIYVLCDEVEKEIDRLFKDYDKITAAGGIVRRKNHFLFIKRNGFWDLPKGKLDENELVEDAAVREIEEECGILKPEIVDFIGVTYHTYEYKGIPTLKKTFWFSLLYDGSKELTPQAEEGITKVKWLKVTELDRIRKNTFASILDVMNTFFGHFEL